MELYKEGIYEVSGWNGIYTTNPGFLFGWTHLTLVKVLEIKKDKVLLQGYANTNNKHPAWFPKCNVEGRLTFHSFTGETQIKLF